MRKTIVHTRSLRVQVQITRRSASVSWTYRHTMRFVQVAWRGWGSRRYGVTRGNASLAVVAFPFVYVEVR